MTRALVYPCPRFWEGPVIATECPVSASRAFPRQSPQPPCGQSILGHPSHAVGRVFAGHRLEVTLCRASVTHFVHTFSTVEGPRFTGSGVSLWTNFLPVEIVENPVDRACGKPVDFLWKKLSTGRRLWITCELWKNLWICGKPVEKLWKTCGKPVDSRPPCG